LETTTVWGAVDLAPNARIYVSALWERFLAHLGAELKERIIDIPDEGMDIDFIKAILAHFIHSHGNIHYYDTYTDLLPALKCDDSFSAFHRFGGTSYVHHQAGSPAYYPYPLPRTRGYGFSQNVKSTNYISVKHFV